MKDYGKLTYENRDDFNRLFNLRLPDFMSSVVGFDIIRFDEWLEPGDNESTRDALLDRFGKDAVALIERIL